MEMDAIIDKKRHTAFPILLKDKIQHYSNEELKRQRAASVIQRTFREKYGSKLENHHNNNYYSTDDKTNRLDVAVVINVGEVRRDMDQCSTIAEERRSNISCMGSNISCIDIDERRSGRTSEEMRGSSEEIVQIHHASTPTTTLQVGENRTKGSRYHSDGPSPTNYHSDGPTPSVVMDTSPMDKDGDEDVSVEEKEHVITISPVSGSRITMIERTVDPSEKESKSGTPSRMFPQEALVYNVQSDISIHLSTRALRGEDGEELEEPLRVDGDNNPPPSHTSHISKLNDTMELEDVSPEGFKPQIKEAAS